VPSMQHGPPLNLLSLPYYLCDAILPYLTSLRLGDGRGRVRADMASEKFTFPQLWLANQSVDRLAAIANRFIAERAPDVVREDRFKHECAPPPSTTF
jgi:hypothetical protein